MPFYDFYSHRTVSPIGRWFAVILAKRLAGLVSKHTPEKSTVLEIGSGDGVVARMLKDRFSYSAYEPNADLASRLREAGVALVREQLVPPLVEESGSVGCVVSSHLLEHMDGTAAAIAFVRDVSRVLKPGGHFILVSPDYLDSPSLFYNADYSHGYVTTPNRVCQLLADGGLTVIGTSFIYGSLPVIPGVFFNWGVKGFFFLISPLRSNMVFKLRGLGKLSYLFLRSMVIVARKK